MGVANERSIAWGISQKLAEAGAELAFTYLGDALKKRDRRQRFQRCASWTDKVQHGRCTA